MSKLENIEAIAIQFLNSKLPTGWTAYGDKPKTPPTKYVLIERSGGGRSDMVLDRAEVQINVYSKNSRLEASNMANGIADYIHEIAENYEDVTRSRVNSLIQNDDTTTQTWRYILYVDMYHRR